MHPHADISIIILQYNVDTNYINVHMYNYGAIIITMIIIRCDIMHQFQGKRNNLIIHQQLFFVLFVFCVVFLLSKLKVGRRTLCRHNSEHNRRLRA